MNQYMTRVKIVTLSSVAPRKIAESFIGPYYDPEGRDPDWNTWLAQIQPGGQAEQIGVWEVEPATTVKRIAGIILHTILLPAQFESLIERTEQGEDVGLLTDSRPNHFFVRTERRDNGGIALGIAPKVNGLWRVSLSTCGLTSDKLRSGTFFS